MSSLFMLEIGLISYIVRIKIRVKLQKILMQQKTYPEDYSCILPPQGDTGGLFIGNLEAAQNVNTLQKHSIKAILTAAKGIDLNHSKQLIPYMFYVPADDHQSFNISPYFDKAADFIASALEKTNIMVHCLAGVSRSVSLVLSYFIKHKNYSYEQAFNLVKSKRRIIHPNDGFIAQLKSFAAKLGTTGRNRSPSPQHHYSVSPQKSSYNNYVTPDVSEFRRSNVGGSLKKHFSISQTMNQQSQIESKYKNYDYSKYQSISPYEDPKYQVASKDTSKNYESFGRIKRLSSLNIPNMQSTINDRRQSYTIFNNIENKQMSPSKHSSNVSDIDRKIEEIRKKYSDMTGYQMNYSNYRGINENKINVENNAWERWKQEGRKDFKYVPDYENIKKNRQYQQYRPPSTTAYFRDSS